MTLFVIGENLLSLIFTKKPSAIFHISLAMIILIALAIKSKYSKILVKLWAIISIIGGLLVVISTLMFWIGGAPERINYESLLVSIIHILVGSEWGGFLELSQDNIICASDCEFSDHNPYLVSENTYRRNGGSDNTVGTNHSHPNAGEGFIRGDGTRGTWGFTVKGDMSRAANRPGYFNAAVDKKNITLYNKSVSIQAPRKFFKK